MMRLIRYFGDKVTLSKKIVPLLPSHSRYREPFCGSSGILFNKPQSAVESISDAYQPMINLLIQCRDRPKELARAVSEGVGGSLLPFPEVDQDSCLISQASNMFLYSSLSWCGGGTRWSTGTKTRKINLENIIVCSERLQDVSIECKDWQKDLPLDDRNALIYLDPPYFHNVRTGSHDNRSGSFMPRRQYAVEFSFKQQLDLLLLIKSAKCTIALSGYGNLLYDQALRDWKRHRISEKEVLWINT